MGPRDIEERAETIDFLLERLAPDPGQPVVAAPLVDVAAGAGASSTQPALHQALQRAVDRTGPEAKRCPSGAARPSESRSRGARRRRGRAGRGRRRASAAASSCDRYICHRNSCQGVFAAWRPLCTDADGVSPPGGSTNWQPPSPLRRSRPGGPQPITGSTSAARSSRSWSRWLPSRPASSTPRRGEAR